MIYIFKKCAKATETVINYFIKDKNKKILKYNE